MKHPITPRLALALALCGAVLPVGLIGCGGGSGGLFSGRPTSQTFALTPTTFDLPNGQSATLTGTRKSDDSARGQILIGPLPSQDRTLTTGTQNAILAGTQFVPGRYDFTGTVNAAGGFDIAGILALINAAVNRTPFRLTGTFPTSAATTYQFTANGETESGTIPAPATPAPTTAPTNGGSPAPTSAPSSGLNLSGVLTYSENSRGAQFLEIAPDFSEVSQTGGLASDGTIRPTITITKTGTLTTLGDGTQVLALNYVRRFSSIISSDNKFFSLSFPSVTGQAFAPGAPRTFTKGDANFAGEDSNGSVTDTTVFELASATIQVNSVSSDGRTVNFTLTNGLFQGNQSIQLPRSPGTGTFTASGTINAANLTLATP